MVLHPDDAGESFVGMDCTRIISWEYILPEEVKNHD